MVNAGDGTHEHPTQALLDAYTMQRRLGSIEYRHLAIVGDLTHSRVVRSNLITLRTLGARVTLVAPPTLMSPGLVSSEDSSLAERASARTGKLPTVGPLWGNDC